MTAAPHRGLANRVARSALTIVSGRILVRMIGLLNTVLLARLLVPEDFGLIAIGVVIMQILENMSDVSASRAVVKFRDAGRDMFDTLFTFSLIKGVVVLTVMVAIAPLAVHFYSDLRIGPVFVALGVIALIKSFRNPRYFEFERDLNFSRELLVSVAAKIMAVAVAITVAVIYRTHWAIILGIALGVMTEVIMSFLMRPFRPRLSFKAFNQLIGFTGWLSAAGALIAINNKAGTLILGRIIGTGPTGVFYVGDQLAGLVGRELTSPIVKALYPGLSSLQGNPERMRRAYLRGAEAMAAIVVPAAFGMAFVAKDLTSLVLGSEWTSAALVIGIVTPVYGLMGVLGGVQGLAMAADRVRSLFFRELYFLLLNIPIMIVASKLYGLEGAVWGSVIVGLIYIALQARLYAITANDNWWRPFWVARRGLLSVIPMAIWFWGVRPHIGVIESMPLVIRFFTDCVSGAAIYGVSILSLWKIENSPDGFESHCFGMIRKRGAA